MICVNKTIISPMQFPDGSLFLKYACENLGENLSEVNQITWKYEGDQELFMLMCLVGKIRGENPNADLALNLPYIPHARMDRVKNPEDILTLKYFATAINHLNFNRVDVFDPHSSVSTALIDRVRVNTPKDIINDVVGDIILNTGKKVSLFFPDEGAMKRYSDMVKAPYCYGVKNRDWKTGKILNIEIKGEENMGEVILICDDICSYGGTFYHSAKKLKQMGAQQVYLYVSHCESSIERGKFIQDDETEVSLLDSSLLEKVYTTDSIDIGNHQMIKKINLFEIKGGN